MGRRRRVISGLNWVFSIVEEAIILEDDCLPDPSFFPFCAELLERYRDNDRISMISGFNALEKKLPTRDSYFFSVIVLIWGWATWRRAWKNYDEHLRSWPVVKADGLLDRMFPDEEAVAYWTRTFDDMHKGTGPNTWDYQWVYSCWANHTVSVVPRRNLIIIMGRRGDATNTTFRDPDLFIPTGPIDSPLRHPAEISPNSLHAKLVHSRFHTPGLLRRVRRKLLRLYASA